MTATVGTPALALTGEELVALARCFGAPRFPGVLATLYDIAGEQLHPALDRRFLATLLARGLLVLDTAGQLWPAEPLAAMMSAAVLSPVYVAVERRDAAGESLCSLLAGERGLLHNRVGPLLHRLELVPDPDPGVRLATELRQLVDCSPGDGRPGRRRYTGRRSALGRVVPAPAGGWRRVSVLVRTDDVGDQAHAEGFLAVFDGGPGEVWLATEDDTDPDREVGAVPASAAQVAAALEELAAYRRGAGPW
ncbi:MAG: hypothetical protein ACRDT6_26000 [Micromonosporaceae bacterium]